MNGSTHTEDEPTRATLIAGCKNESRPQVGHRRDGKGICKSAFVGVCDESEATLHPCRNYNNGESFLSRAMSVL